MPLTPTQARATALRVTKWLLDKGRRDDAVAMAASWAANGPNDTEGQALLAEALRISPGSPLAKAAFERMEGVGVASPILDEAMVRFDLTALEQLEKEMSRPAFRRAQVGFNNNIKWREQVFHVQTEDSGLDKPHIITHLFADGGRIIKSHKRMYTELVDHPDVSNQVRALMKGQHLEMALMLREGAFDEILAGRAMGGMQLLSDPPKTDVQKLATQKKQKVAAQETASHPAPRSVPPPPPAAPVAVAAPRARSHFRLHVTRSLGGGPLVYEPMGEEAIIGSKGAIALPGERFCHPREARIMAKQGQLWLCDLEGGNGVFLRIRSPVALDHGDEFLVGDQLLRVERNPPASDYPAEGPTYFATSPQWVSSFRVVQVFIGGALGACVLARGTTLHIGAVFGDFILPGDPLISDQHCFIEEQAGDVLLSDSGAADDIDELLHHHREPVGDRLYLRRALGALDGPLEVVEDGQKVLQQVFPSGLARVFDLLPRSLSVVVEVGRGPDPLIFHPRGLGLRLGNRVDRRFGLRRALRCLGAAFGLRLGGCGRGVACSGRFGLGVFGGRRVVAVGHQEP
jgi:hypothetical protein